MLNDLLDAYEPEDLRPPRTPAGSAPGPLAQGVGSAPAQAPSPTDDLSLQGGSEVGELDYDPAAPPPCAFPLIYEFVVQGALPCPSELPAVTESLLGGAYAAISADTPAARQARADAAGSNITSLQVKLRCSAWDAWAVSWHPAASAIACRPYSSAPRTIAQLHVSHKRCTVGFA